MYLPLLLMNKKRYAGPLWTSTVKHDYIDSKGLETVRRDNCRLAKDIIGTALDRILLDQNPQKAIEYVKHKVGLLLQNKVDISDLVVTKGLTKTASDYKSLGPNYKRSLQLQDKTPNQNTRPQ